MGAASAPFPILEQGTLQPGGWRRTVALSTRHLLFLAEECPLAPGEAQ